jgi:hypothetical protein
MFAAESRGDVPRGTAERWEAHTPKGKRLPEKVKAAAGRRPVKKKAEMTKWTAFVDEVGRLSEGGEGDSDSSSASRFPYSGQSETSR